AGVRRALPGEDLHGGGLARPVAPHQPDPVAGLDPQGGLGQEGAAAGPKLKTGSDDHVWLLALTTRSRYPPRPPWATRFTPAAGGSPPPGRRPPRRAARRDWGWGPAGGAGSDAHAT